MDKAKCGRLLCMVLSTLVLSGCGVEEHYYVKTDGSPDILHGVSRSAQPASSPAPINLGVTFKSAGKVLPAATDVLYRSVSDGLRVKGQWDVHRLGSGRDDFAPVIAAVMRAQNGPAVPGLADSMQRMLVLVENSPDLSAGTRINYFLSGMSFGVHGPHQPTDRYDVTIAYRDAVGVNHVYRSHQDLLLAVDNKYVSHPDMELANLKPYDTSLAAFNGIVLNSINGTQRAGVVSVGKPRISPPAPAAVPINPPPATPSTSAEPRK